MSMDPELLLLGLEEIFPENNLFFRQLRTAIEKYPNANWNDALSKGQILSKLWLIDELKKLDLDLGTVFVLGGWVGMLPALIFKDGELRFNRIRSFDLDAEATKAAEALNRDAVINDWKFKATTLDMFKIDYSRPQYLTLRSNGSSVLLTEFIDTVINTSCDHIAPFESWWNRIPKKTLVVLQNNDFFGADEDHVNNVNSLEEMKAQAPMNEILFEGVLQFPRYDRFMLIGRK